MSIKSILGLSTSTNDLYWCKLLTYEYYTYQLDESMGLMGSPAICYHFNPIQPYALCRKQKDRYIDVLGKKIYKDFILPMDDKGTVIVEMGSAVNNSEKRIKYKDAEKILEAKNSAYIKSKFD